MRSQSDGLLPTGVDPSNLSPLPCLPSGGGQNVHMGWVAPKGTTCRSRVAVQCKADLLYK